MANEPNPHAAPISMEFQSTHVESLRAALETVDVNDEQGKVSMEIESSKVHWSELASSYYTATEGPTMDSSSAFWPKWVNEEGTPEWELEVVEDNVRVFRSLQERYPSGFFLDENDLGPNCTQRIPKWMLNHDGTPLPVEFGLSSESPFAEGGQAKLFRAHVIDLRMNKKGEILVMKVFKEGTALRDLLKLFPSTMLASDETCIQGGFGGNKNINLILGARLLKSTRQFAFLMRRAWGDLRKLIEKRMLHFHNQGPPFPNDLAFFIIHDIAKGMMELHERDIIHRDLKAANVLIFRSLGGRQDFHHVINPIHLQPHQFRCEVADFECSVGVVGTGFWRAPEILEVVKNRIVFQKPELFTKQADVYSFGMTCFEILSGGLPFEDLGPNDFDKVIGGLRPMLPSQTPPWMVDLVNRCWHKDPSMRPPFEEIVKILEPYVLNEEEKESLVEKIVKILELRNK